MIEFTSVSEYYSSGFFSRKWTCVVDDVSLAIRQGETLCLVGESGSGKSTLARMMIRLVEPSPGRIVFDGIDLLAFRKPALLQLRSRMQIVFQDPDTAHDPQLTIGASVAEPLVVWQKAGQHERDDRVAELFGMVGLQPDLAVRWLFELPWGQKQRAALSRAIALEPEFLVLAEPTAALDLSVQAPILSLIQVIRKRLNLTLLFISHDLHLIRRMSDSLEVLHEGRIVESRKTAEVLRRPSDTYTVRFLEAAREGGVWLGNERPDSGS